MRWPHAKAIAGPDRRSQVEHFAGEVNARELAEETGGETAKRFEKVVGDRLFVPMEAWIDEEGRPRGSTMSVDTGGESMSMTVDILEYGVPVDVQAPPGRDDVREGVRGLTAG